MHGTGRGWKQVSNFGHHVCRNVGVLCLRCHCIPVFNVTSVCGFYPICLSQCKHILAVYLSEAMAVTQQESVTDQQMTMLLRRTSAPWNPGFSLWLLQLSRVGLCLTLFGHCRERWQRCSSLSDMTFLKIVLMLLVCWPVQLWVKPHPPPKLISHRLLWKCELCVAFFLHVQNHLQDHTFLTQSFKAIKLKSHWMLFFNCTWLYIFQTEQIQFWNRQYFTRYLQIAY